VRIEALPGSLDSLTGSRAGSPPPALGHVQACGCGALVLAATDVVDAHITLLVAVLAWHGAVRDGGGAALVGAVPSVAVLAVAAGGVLFGAGALLSVGGGVDMDSAHALSAAVLACGRTAAGPLPRQECTSGRHIVTASIVDVTGSTQHNPAAVEVALTCRPASHQPGVAARRQPDGRAPAELRPAEARMS
jgi:hypothetical protein